VLAWQAGDIVGRWIAERRLTQARQQADEKAVRRAIRDICGREPTREEQRAAHDAKGTYKGERSRLDLLHDLLDNMDCDQDLDELKKWEEIFKTDRDGLSSIGGIQGER
jgi:hypothetical protein